jgi:hypothetical protein
LIVSGAAEEIEVAGLNAPSLETVEGDGFDYHLARSRFEAFVSHRGHRIACSEHGTFEVSRRRGLYEVPTSAKALVCADAVPGDAGKLCGEFRSKGYVLAAGKALAKLELDETSWQHSAGVVEVRYFVRGQDHLGRQHAIPSLIVEPRD